MPRRERGRTGIDADDAAIECLDLLVDAGQSAAELAVAEVPAGLDNP